MREIRSTVDGWDQQGLRSGLATLVRVTRSAPRAPGARFAVNERGDLVGSVSSGCVEGDLHEHIGRVLAGGPARVVHYGISDEMAADVGLSCGGEIEVLVAEHAAADPAWAALGPVLEGGAAAVLLTGLSEEIRGRQLLVREDETPVGTLGDATLDEAAREAALPLLRSGGTPVLRLPNPETEVFAEAFLPPPRLAIVGATPVAAALCHLAAYAGYEVWIVDPREAFAREERFPEAAGVLRVWPEEGLRSIGVGPYVDVVVLAHDAKLDVPALEVALGAGCDYVGLLGGGRTQRLRRQALAEREVGPASLDRIHGPVGLDIGAKSPVEIALSILAQVLAVRRGRVAS